MKHDLDPTKLQDWEVAEKAEDSMKSVFQLADDLGLEKDEILPYGHFMGKVDYSRVYERLKEKPSAKYIDVTAITPTPLGEGKTTTTIGLIQGLGHLGKKVTGAIRQPSGGPTFNIKGSAAGGGLSQCIPLSPLSLGLTGDIDCVTNAHNLAMVALTSRLQHEFNYGDATLAKKNLKRLDIDPCSVQTGWAIDFCAQALRQIIVGIGSKMDGLMMRSGFQISVSSEVMAILAMAQDLKDLRERMGKIVLACDKRGNDVTTADLEVDGAMTAWMVRAMNPNIIQTLEGQPIFVHAGPFANIAVGQSSIIADKLGTKLADYHVTESGFGADIGFEKFWNIKCRVSGLKPDAVVIVATIRALKMHGGGPAVVPGKTLDPAYSQEDLALLEKGCENLVAHIETVKKSCVQPIVCVNAFHTDSPSEIDLVKRISEEHGAYAAFSNHWMEGGEGAVELAEAVITACEQGENFRMLYPDSMRLSERIRTVATEIYGGDDVSYSPTALDKMRAIESDPNHTQWSTCMVKTHLSLSHDPTQKGRPTGWTLPIQDILMYKGAGFIVPVAGDIKLMPGTASDPAYRKIDVDVKTGKVRGLF